MEAETFTVDIDAALQDYSDTVYKIALSQTKDRHDADDVFQEVFLRLITNLNKIQSREHLKAWLIRVTLNCCKTHYRVWRMRSAELIEDIPYITPEEHDIFYAVLELPQKYKTVIHLFYYEELSVKQIGEILDMKESTVKSQLFRAREMLRDALKGEDETFAKSI